jgi:tetratricopeptide (TPR) repeat protein
VSFAKLYRKLNDYENLEKVYKRLVASAKSNAEKASILAEYLNILEKAGRKQDQAKVNDQIIFYAQNVKENSKLGQASYYLAKAKFDATKKLKDKYLEVVLRLPPEDLVYLLKRKQKLLTQLISAYDNVIDYGVPEFGVAALNQKSEAYKNFVDSYRKVTVPKKYQGKEKEELETQLKTLDTQIIKPFDEKVNDTLKTCVARASEFLIVTEDSKSCKKRLAAVDTQQPQIGTLPTARAEYIDAPKEEKRLFIATEGLKQNKKELAKFLYAQEEKNNTKYQYLIDYNLGLLALHEKNRNLYVDYFEKAYKNSQSPLIDNQLGVLYLQAENFSKAEQIFKASVDKKNTEVGLHGLAASLLGNGKKSESDSMYEKCHSEYPEYAPCNQRKRESK